MKNSIGLSISILALSMAALTGCQAGKFRKPAFVDNLAFWNKDSELDKDYIEPPSALFTPTDTNSAVAEKSDGPPTRPDSGIENDTEELNRKVADSYRKLSTQSDSADSANRELAGSKSEATRDIKNAVASDHDAAFYDLNRPTTLKNTPNIKQGLSANVDSSSRISNWNQLDGSMPKAQKVSNQFAQGPLMPAADNSDKSNSPGLPKTTYAKTAVVDSSNGSAKISNPYIQTKSQPTGATNEKIADVKQSADGKQILNPYFPKQQLPIEKNQSSITTSPPNNRVANPYFPKNNAKPESALIAATSPPQTSRGNSTDNPNSMISVEVGTANNQQASYNGYPITPHKPFLPRKIDSENSSSKNSVRVASLPANLLRGQGTYAPGSVKAPDADLPGQIPANSSSNQ